uniref:Uncharacterized protein n=1 Tax=Ditylenchus dipsaci TaxID=166011 RepID=A0A915CY88_9BILA
MDSTAFRTLIPTELNFTEYQQTSAQQMSNEIRLDENYAIAINYLLLGKSAQKARECVSELLFGSDSTEYYHVFMARIMVLAAISTSNCQLVPINPILTAEEIGKVLSLSTKVVDVLKKYSIDDKDVANCMANKTAVSNSLVKCGGIHVDGDVFNLLMEGLRAARNQLRLIMPWLFHDPNGTSFYRCDSQFVKYAVLPLITQQL